MDYGAAWYPEQWPEERWPTDLRLMREAGMNVVRVGEFAWSRMEPAEGRLDLGWLRRAVDRAAEHGIAVVLGTPSATPPAWLTQAYPEVLAVNEHGEAARHGARCHYRVTSRRYLDHCRRIAAALAAEFGSHPNVIGWQIDNEYWRVSFDGETEDAFRAYLREQYGTLEALNAAWTTAYWSQTYFDWSQVRLPAGWDNPCLALAMRRFFTCAYRRFQRVQLDAIRERADPRQWITHNAHAHPWLDWVELGQDLDLASWDPYLGVEHLAPDRFGFVSDLCRNIRPARKHWIIETQPGRVSWAKTNTDLHGGETRNLVWHFVGHGAGAVLFWQWRSPLGGQEQYHGTLLGADGTPRPVYAEIAQAGRELARASAVLDGKRPRAHVAVIHTYPDRWALLNQPHHADFDPVRHAEAHYAALRRRGLTVDVVDPAVTPLAPYRLVVAPALHLLDDALVAALETFVAGGGHLLLGARSGFKDAHNAMLPSRQPGARLGERLGARVEEYYALAEPVPLEGTLGRGACETWAEPLEVVSPEAEVLLTFGAGNAWLAGKPALVSRRHGKGRLTYLGACPDAGAMDAIMAWAADASSVPSPVLAAPDGVSLHELVGADGVACILNNCTGEEKTVPLPGTWRDALTDTACADALTLPPRGVALLVRPGDCRT